MLAILSFLAASALPASAGQVEAVPAFIGVPPTGGAAVSGSVAPMVLYKGVKSGDIQSAMSLLGSPSLQEWLWASRPNKASGVIAQARRLADFGELARVYGKEANHMRWAILMRDDKAFHQPGTAAKLLGANQFLEGSYETAYKAYCSWDSLEAREREGLEQRGHGAGAWAKYPLPERVRLLREYWIAALDARIPGSPLHPEYGPVIRGFLARAGGYLNDDEYATMSQDADRSERLIERAEEMKTRAQQAGDRATLEGLSRVAKTGDVDSARAEFDRVFTGAGGDANLTEVPQALPETTLAFVAAELPRVVRAMAEGSPAAAVLDGAEAFGPLKVAFVRTSARNIAQYEPALDRLVFNPDDLAEFLRAEGRASADLLSDRSLLARYALALGPVFVHEATHARQHRLIARRGLSAQGRFYQQAMEIEAFAVQGSFARGVAAKWPSARAAVAALSAKPELRRLTLGWNEHEKLVRVVRATYRRVPGSHRAWLKSMKGLAGEIENLKPYERPVLAELARRRGLPVAERLRLEREGAEQAAPVEGLKTSVLRRIAAWVVGGSRKTVEAVTEANAEIMANAKASLDAYERMK